MFEMVMCLRFYGLYRNVKNTILLENMSSLILSKLNTFSVEEGGRALHIYIKLNKNFQYQSFILIPKYKSRSSN